MHHSDMNKHVFFKEAFLVKMDSKYKNEIRSCLQKTIIATDMW